MKKSIFMALIFSLILTGCATKENFSITSNSDKWWKMMIESYRGKIIAVAPFGAVTPLEEYLEFKLRVEIDLDEPLAKPILNKKYGEKCHQYVKEHKGDIMRLEFQSYNLTDKYQFDSSKVYLITPSQKYHLRTVDYATREPIGYSINDLDGKFYRNNNYFYGPRLHYYHLPIICKQLDGAYFEISGIYQNGVELPPIQFQVSVLTRYKSIDEIVFDPLNRLLL